MFLKEINPFIRQAIIASLNINNVSDTFNELQTRDCRLFYILSDSGSMVIDGVAHELHRGCVILFQSGTKYMWRTDSKNAISYISVNFDYTHAFCGITKNFHPVHSSRFKASDIFETVRFEDAQILNNPIVIDNLTYFESEMRLLTVEFYLGNEYCDELLSSVLKSLIIKIVKLKNENLSSGKKETRTAEKIIEYIQNNYTKDLSNRKIAEHFHINPVYMNRVFKKQTNTSVHAFILNYRLNTAMNLLRSESTSVKEIAIMSGFSDPIHFNKIFKKHTGTTPNQYRNMKI